ncbi:uncharacterized protein BROUX77_003309 [Berkeleyomyces rouxiae]|uniref:uncharacterized protein n=1 Tax=Berkeleyomyces rouxiae TaxID=2035830 RepID=UPI003B8189DB
MKASIILLAGASTVSAGWLNRICAKGFPCFDDPEPISTLTSVSQPTNGPTAPDDGPWTVGLGGGDASHDAYSGDSNPDALVFVPSSFSTVILPAKTPMPESSGDLQNGAANRIPNSETGDQEEDEEFHDPDMTLNAVSDGIETAVPETPRIIQTYTAGKFADPEEVHDNSEPKEMSRIESEFETWLSFTDSKIDDDESNVQGEETDVEEGNAEREGDASKVDELHLIHHSGHSH